MGIGDEIMVSGEVRRAAGGTHRRFAIIDMRINRQRIRWDDVWQGNPRIARPGSPYDAEIVNGPGNRPYIERVERQRFFWREYRPEVGELFLTQSELALSRVAHGRVVFHPYIKDKAPRNKLWPLQYWAQLIAATPKLRWLQIGAEPSRAFRGVDFQFTRSFREACGVLAGADAAVLLEGGLHHAAAALGVKAVVIFGGYISPKVTGYPSQRSLYVEHDAYPLGCGFRLQCRHCEVAMHSIKPETVKDELERLLCNKTTT